jgi:hypothetical protein
MNSDKKIVTGLGLTLALALTLMFAQSVHAYKVTSTSYQDGFNRGVNDANRDWQRLNGHGFDDSCPSGHTDVYCSGYFKGYNTTWDTLKEDYIVDSNGNTVSNAQSSTVGIEGNNNRVNVIQGQTANNGDGSDGGDSGDGDGSLNPKCKVLCGAIDVH